MKCPACCSEIDDRSYRCGVWCVDWAKTCDQAAYYYQPHVRHSTYSAEVCTRSQQFDQVGAELMAFLPELLPDLDLDVVVNHSHLAQRGFGDLAIGWDNDFARLSIDHVERNLLTQQNVRKRIGQFRNKVLVCQPIVFVVLISRHRLSSGVTAWP